MQDGCREFVSYLLYLRRRELSGLGNHHEGPKRAWLEEEEQKEVDRLQRIRKDLASPRGNELGVMGEGDEREEFVFDF